MVFLSKADNKLAYLRSVLGVTSGSINELEAEFYAKLISGELVLGGGASGPIAIADVTGLQSVLDNVDAALDETTVGIAALDARPMLFVSETEPTVPPEGMRDIDVVLVHSAGMPPITYIENLEFEALTGANNATVVAAEAGWDNMVSTPQVVKPGLLSSVAAVRFAGTATENGAVDVTAATALRISATLLFTTLASGSSIYILRGRNVAGAVDGPGVRINTSLTMQIINNTTAVGSASTHVFATGEQIHIEFAFDLTAGTAELLIWYPGNTTLTPNETLTVTGVTWNVTPAQGVTRVAMGLLAAAASNPSIVVDNVRISAYGSGRHPVTA